MTSPLYIVVPMAGLGSRFVTAGVKLPKPLIPVMGVPMIRLVIENIRPSQPHRFIFICQRAHVTEYDVAQKLATWAPDCKIVVLDGVTEGAACTVLTAKDEIDPHAPLMIANSDQYVQCAMDDYLAAMNKPDVDGLIMTMWANDPKWSFVGFDKMGKVNRVVEKTVISNEATVGIYNFRRGKDFIDGAEEMIRRGLRVNNEFYVAPVYNLLIEDGYRIAVHNVGREHLGMHGLGTPEDLEKFLTLPLARHATNGLAA